MADSAHFKKLKEYKIEWVHYDKAGVHSEIKMIEKLWEDCNGDSDSFPNNIIIGTTLRVCAHRNLILNVIKRKKRINFKTRECHLKFCNHKDTAIPQIIENDDNLKQEYF